MHRARWRRGARRRLQHAPAKGLDTPHLPHAGIALSRVKDVGGQVLSQVGDARRGVQAQPLSRRGADPPPRAYRLSLGTRTATTLGGAA
jgi:hypothetical protein